MIRPNIRGDNNCAKKTGSSSGGENIVKTGSEGVGDMTKSRNSDIITDNRIRGLQKPDENIAIHIRGGRAKSRVAGIKVTH